MYEAIMFGLWLLLLLVMMMVETYCIDHHHRLINLLFQPIDRSLH